MPAHRPPRIGRAAHLAGIAPSPLGMQNQWYLGTGPQLGLHSWGKDQGVVGGNWDSPTEVVVIPGFSGDMRTCNILADLFRKHGCLVRSVNLPSHFGSPRHPRSLEDVSEYFVGALKKYSFGDRRLVLCSASSASTASWRVAIELKDRLHAFVSIAGHDYRPRVRYERMLGRMLTSPFTQSEPQPNSPSSRQDLKRLGGHIANDFRAAFTFGRVLWYADATNHIKEFRELGLPLVSIGAECDDTSPPWMFLRTQELANPRAAAILPKADHRICTLEGPMMQMIVDSLLWHLTTDGSPEWVSLQTAFDAATGRSTAAWIAEQSKEATISTELGLGLAPAPAFGAGH